MRHRTFTLVVLLLVFGMLGVLVWVSNNLGTIKRKAVPAPKVGGQSQIAPTPPPTPTAGEMLLAGYGDPAAPPIEDLRKLQHVATGYFSVIKDSARFPIGGNEDFSAALRGENPNREVFVRAGNPVFSPAGLLVDRWGSPVIVHPQAWRQLELRSAGPDRIPYNDDDLILAPNGVSSGGR
ncbi:MAG: hypothetical protein ABIT37_07835 [Luteolibacter sp.]